MSAMVFLILLQAWAWLGQSWVGYGDLSGRREGSEG